MHDSARAAATVLMATALTACAAPTTIGAKASRLTPGVTTISDAIAVLGPPRSRSTMPNGGVLLQWMELNPGFLKAKGAHVAVLFDASGKMLRVTHEYQSDPA